MGKVIMIVSEVGYTWEEVIVPYLEYKEQGWKVDFATISGGEPKLDPFSVKVRPLLNKVGFGISKALAPETTEGKELLKALQTRIAVVDINEDQYDAIFLAGGHGSLFDINKSEVVHQVLHKFHIKGKKLVAICHASSTLAYVKENGKSLIEDRKITGFPTLQELFILRFGMIHKRFLPLPLWTGKELDKYSKKRGFGLKLAEVLNQEFVVKDENIITGVGPKAGRALVKKAVE